jgi:hypothetical protein
MTGEVKLEFAATTLNEAVMLATTKWRTLIEDPEATLPWSTHIAFYEMSLDDYGPSEADKPVKMQTMALVRIEFDRKLVDEITGVTTANA